MKRVLDRVFSMRLMAVFLLAFFIAIGWATFVENDYGTPVAQKWIYKTTWFELILLYLSLSLCFNIYRYQLFQWKKLGSLVFHLSFLVIIIGAAITRYFGFEGAMAIREGGSSNLIVSYDTFIQIKAHDFKQQYVNKIPVILDGHTDNYFEHSFNFPGVEKPIEVEFVSLVDHAKDSLVPQGKSSGDPYVEIVTVGQSGRQYNYLKSGDVLPVGNFKIAFNNHEHTDAVSIFETDSGIQVMTPYDLTYFQMSDQSNGMVSRDSVQAFKTKRLYTLMGQQFVFNTYYPSAALETVESKEIPRDVKAVTLKVTQGDLSKEVVLRGGKGQFPVWNKFEMGGLNFEMAYGSRIIELPFFLFLDDFEMKRYPGTNNPSSFSSWVTLADPRTNLEEKHHIYMNHVLDYDGYRFFQSSYDPDEQGTILSVNHDGWGTGLTYLGYFLLGLGFIINLFNREGRFKFLMKKAKDIREKREKLTTLIIAGLMVMSSAAWAQSDHDAEPTVVGEHDHSTEESARHNPLMPHGIDNPVIDYEHGEKFGHLVIQDIKGRFQPVHTLASNILKKVSRQSTYNGQSPMQVFLGIHTNLSAWNLEPFIYVSGKEVREKLNLTDSRAALVDFFTLDLQHYLLEEDAERARLKKPAERSTYDKDVLKTDERLNIIYGMFTGLYLKIMPLPNDPGERWFSPFDPEHPFEGDDADFMNTIVPLYVASVKNGHDSGDWSQADKVVELIDIFQRKVANPDSIPGKEKIKWEIAYNKLDIFKWLNWSYLMVGFILLVFQFVQIFRPKLNLKWPMRIGFILFLLMAIAHGIGLGIRWYLSGHAPWSNGYEAVVFIAFVTALAGLFFSKQSKIVLGATGILAWLMLFVAHMNALDPDITNLQPVLKSYWLMIHVAIITGSYGFLGLGAILGLICLCMNLFLGGNAKKRILLTTKELTYVSEMTIIVGLFMLTIGTFLGGVWANESWGRYWGWDAKETWALASILVYAIILHFRFIPGLKGQFAFNVASLWGYGSIIMTFFGVNYYLSGLHSYATGDPIPIPNWVPVTIILLLVLSIISGIMVYRSRKTTK